MFDCEVAKLLDDLPDHEAFMLLHDDDCKLLYGFNSGIIMSLLSGFSGSSGICIVGRNVRLFASDSRYELQSKKEIPSKWCIEIENKNMPLQLFSLLCDSGVKKLNILGEFCSTLVFEQIASYLFDKGIVVVPVSTVELERILGISLVPDMIDELLESIPETKVGLVSDKKISDLLAKSNHPYLLLTNKHYISWLTNKRRLGCYSDPSVGFNLLLYSSGDDVVVKECYSIDDIVSFLGKGKTVVLDKKFTAIAITDSLYKCGTAVSFIDLNNAYATSNIKHATEQKEIVQSHIYDGVAIVKFLCWLDNAISEKCYPTEKEAAIRLEQFRGECKFYRGNSFPTISAFGENAAIVHYSNPSDSVRIEPNGLYLFDSGGQYYYGTTDITRTISVGCPTERQKTMFTAVLKGHISLATAIFTRQTPSNAFDFLARSELYCVSANYGHSTGHGVGYMGAVHEGPANISQSSSFCIQSGMLLSNEPGYYESGSFGIRTENLMLSVNATDENSGFLIVNNGMKVDDSFLCFRTVSFAPIDIRLINLESLSLKEVKWLNFYHRYVRDVLSNHLDQKERAWLSHATQEV